jgi:hypothetical protein
MSNPQKRRGDEGEREAQEILRRLMKLPHIRRALGAGRKDDVGDIHGVPNTVIQVTWMNNLNTAVNTKLHTVDDQRKNARARFGALWVRRDRSPWVVVQTPEQFATMLRWANYGVKQAAQREWERGTD